MALKESLQVKAAGKPGSEPPPPAKSQPDKKRKAGSDKDGKSQKQGATLQPHDYRAPKRARFYENRVIAAQTPHAALKDGELDVQAFVNSMEFEIKALDESMRRTRTSKNSRAFQRVPFTMRRRVAAHNDKRVPKRLQKRARREMTEDNTPTVNSKTKKPRNTKAWQRVETARRLGVLARRKKLLKLKKRLGGDKETINVRAARPKIKTNALNDPPVLAPKYRKRQLNKTWLPTHLWHAKRATMTAPTQPLWRFAIPLTPTQKCYRPTHRAQWEKGVVAWDMSYLSTIGLSGSPNSLQHVLKALGLTQDSLWSNKGNRWRAGDIYWSGMLSRKFSSTTQAIGQATIIWNPEGIPERTEANRKPNKFRQLLMRIHPAAFLETFNELLRLGKMQHPRPYVQDLRYEIGSIEVTGPDSTEALLSVLRPYYSAPESKETQAAKFKSLMGVRDSSALPRGSLLGFSIADPRLRYPPRCIVPPNPSCRTAQITIADALAVLRNDEPTKPYELFDRDVRFKASRLPSQQSLNRRHDKGPPSTILEPTKVDPPIPILLLASRNSPEAQAPGTWTLMLPWKCVLPVWYSLMHYPLSTGGNPGLGGLNETRQLSFESGQAWFPGDYPGTNAGQAWELQQRLDRRKAWDRMPKARRVAWESLDLGAGRKGEVGIGWNCDYEILFGLRSEQDLDQMQVDEPLNEKQDETTDNSVPKHIESASMLSEITHITKAAFNSSVKDEAVTLPGNSLVTARIRITTRGVPATCARVYRLPGFRAAVDMAGTEAEVPATHPPPNAGSKLPANLREQWLAQKPSPTNTKKSLTAVPADREARQQRLAQQLIGVALSFPSGPSNSEDVQGHPLCPDEEDLIGFVTTGSFNLRDGRGEGIASLSAARAMEELKRYNNAHDPGVRMCVVRNAGHSVGWLAQWELI